MRLIPWDPDVETIARRIKTGDIDLQPDFQRGEVWTQPKQKRLVDSILRAWHIPPIHVVENEETKVQEVLDGQQRLAAIRDFVNGVFAVDGRIEPYDEEIYGLHGTRYEELPVEWRRKFDQFSIRVFKIVEFEPEEPAELFFRLNQPTKLTSAEQRNAFFGPARSLVKKLASSFNDVPIGFSNARMAVDDVVARVCMSVESGTVLKKVTATKLANRYRSDFGSRLCLKSLSPNSLPMDDSASQIHSSIFSKSSGRKETGLPKRVCPIASWFFISTGR